MLGLSWSGLLKGLAAILCALGVISLALIYFIPTPPSKISMATSVIKGTTYDFYAQRYRERFARANVKLEFRESPGSVETLDLLQDAVSGVQFAFMYGGTSDGEHTPGLLSLGIVYNNPFWVFYSSAEPLDRLSQLKGKRIAVGPAGTAVRKAAEQVLGTDGVTATTAIFLPHRGNSRGRGTERRQGRCLLDRQCAGIASHPNHAENAQRSAHELRKGRGAHSYLPRPRSADIASGRV
jgi:hypothetical protein